MRQHGGRSREPSSVKFTHSPERLTKKIKVTSAREAEAALQVYGQSPRKGCGRGARDYGRESQGGEGAGSVRKKSEQGRRPRAAHKVEYSVQQFLIAMRHQLDEIPRTRKHIRSTQYFVG